MPDLTILGGLAGSGLLIVGAVTLAVMLLRRARPPVLPVDVPSWAAELPSAAPELAAAIIPAVSDDAPTALWGRHDAGTTATSQHTGRHYEDTVEIRPPGWMPAIGARRIAAQLDDTQLQPRAEADQ